MYNGSLKTILSRLDITALWHDKKGFIDSEIEESLFNIPGYRLSEFLNVT